MDNSARTEPKRSPIAPDLVSFKRTYSRSKLLGIVAVILWVFGLVEVAFADLLKTSWRASTAISVIAVGLISGAAFLYYRAGTRGPASPASCLPPSEDHCCAQPGCDLAGGGCLGKFENEMTEGIAQMEREKLRLLLRRKVGVEIALPLFWLAVGVKVALSSGSGSEFGGLALVIGSVGLIATRLYLGAGVFS